MEVADSHMLEQPSTFTPSSHIDIDMSGDYYDEEYMMHDAHPTTELVDDEEIYDAEIEEQVGHTEVEMDEYRDELIDDHEANMGTYVPADDATVTDVTVEDLHLPSSSVASGTPLGPSPKPVAAHSISPHVAAGVDLVINEASPADPLSTHSPQSTTTLVGDLEGAPLEEENAKIAHGLHEVINLAATNDANPPPADVSTTDSATHEGAQNDFELAQAELYEEEGTPTVTNSPVLHPSVVDQPQDADLPALHDASDSLATTLHDSEPVEQHDDRANDESHSPIEDALVLNQQVRDDAADTMEPSPPVRLSYDDKASGTTQVFDIFSPIDSSPESIDVLFADNRTLFYDPLSVFFTKLRETNHFSDDDWQDAEMGLTVDLNGHRLSITEDHKQTDQVSLFRLYFVWSGLGLEGPLRLTLQRHPDRFAVRYAQLVVHLEQRDVHGDGIEELHEVVRREIQGGAVDSTSNHGEGGDYLLAATRYQPLTVRVSEGEDHTESVQQAPAETHDVDNAHDSERNSEPPNVHAVEEDARPSLDVTEHSGVADGQRNEGDDDGEDGDEFPHNSKSDDENTHVGQAVIDALGQIDTIQAPASPVGETGQDGPTDSLELNGDLYNDDEYADEYPDEGNTSGDAPEQRDELVPLPDKEYDEYEEVEEANHLAPAAQDEGSEGHDGDSEDYYNEYDDVDEEGKFIQAAGNDQSSSESPHQVSAGLQNADLPLETSPHSPARHPLKRNLDDLENDSQEAAGSPTPPLPADSKRPKHT